LIAEDENVGSAVFGGKEVLLKIIEKPANAPEDELLTFIESISDATNQQSRIVEADRRANDPKLLELQQHFFDEYGLFLERKRGEFQYGLDSKVINRTNVIDRADLLRAFTAFAGEPSKARSSEGKMFEEERFEQLLSNFDLVRITRSYFTLQAIEEANQERKQQDLPTVTSGKYALLAATATIGNDIPSLARPVQEQAAQNVRKVMSKWSEFQDHIRTLSGNSKYAEPNGFNFDGYYKGSTVTSDIMIYTWD
jgi:hypothetical protein